MLTECRRACRVALTSHAKRVRDRVEAGGGAVGARAGRLVLGVEDDVLGRLAASRRARGVRGTTTEKRHHHTHHTWLGLGLGLRIGLRIGLGLGHQHALHLSTGYRVGLRIGLGLGHDHTHATSTGWL